jgi:nucleolar complex protein 2
MAYILSYVSVTNSIMGKLQKSTKKFAASGRLKKVIKARHAQQKRHKKRPVRRRDVERDEEKISPLKQTKDDDDVDMESDLEVEREIATDDDESDDDLKGRHPLSFFYTKSESVITDDGEAHVLELAQLAKKDPEFYQYLQENDRDLLEFNDTTDISIITDGAKLIPYIIRSRKAVKQYLKVSFFSLFFLVVFTS